MNNCIVRKISFERLPPAKVTPHNVIQAILICSFNNISAGAKWSASLACVPKQTADWELRENDEHLRR